MSNDAPIHEWESGIDHYTEHYVPYSLRRVCGFFNVPQIYYMCKGLWDGAYGLSSLSEKTRKSNRLLMLLQRQHLLLSYLKTLNVGPAGVWTYGLLSERLEQAIQCSRTSPEERRIWKAKRFERGTKCREETFYLLAAVVRPQSLPSSVFQSIK